MMTILQRIAVIREQMLSRGIVTQMIKALFTKMIVVLKDLLITISMIKMIKFLPMQVRNRNELKSSLLLKIKHPKMLSNLHIWMSRPRLQAIQKTNIVTSLAPDPV